MGQKVNPNGMRIGVIRDWESKWYANSKDFATYLHEDIKIRKVVESSLSTPENDALVSHVEIERVKGTVEVFIHCVRPGVVLGQEGKNIADLNKKLTKICGGKKVKITVVEVKRPNLDATLVAKDMAKKLEARASFRTVQKQAIAKVMKDGAKGIKTSVSGRLGGADIARSEGYNEGVVPLHTLRADIDFAIAEAATTYGRLGVKVWICRGEILPTRNAKTETPAKGE